MRADIIKMALSQVGYKEESKGVSIFTKWFGFANAQPEEWCGVFCSWVFAMAGYPLGIIDYFKGFAGLYFALNFWRKMPNPDGSIGRLTKNPLPGDLVIYSWNQDGNPSHVGIFSRFINDTTLEAIEGNTSDGNPSDGGCVEIKQRNTSLVLCYVNPLLLPPDAPSA